MRRRRRAVACSPLRLGMGGSGVGGASWGCDRSVDCDSEGTELDGAIVAGHKDIGGLEIAMEDSAAMHVVQRVAKGLEEANLGGRTMG